ncbi:MAG TPA: tetratricopeptide repeat protein, partial [Deltaproteobacteria bacterium]|nr:tetratricopeptide repeat protein [Deltaproteobacteria bacterium]
MMRNTFIALLLALLLASCATLSQEKRKETAEIHYRMGSVYFAERNYTAALEEVLKAVKLYPNNPEYHNLLGLIYGAKRLYDNAQIHFRQAIKIKPDFSEAH